MSFYYGKKKGMNEVELPTDPNIPAWIITPKEERAVFERWKAKTFAICDDYIRIYVECSNSYKNPVEAMRKCEKANQNSIGCVRKYQTLEYLDKEKDLYIKEKLEKRKQAKELAKMVKAENQKSK